MRKSRLGTLVVDCKTDDIDLLRADSIEGLGSSRRHAAFAGGARRASSDKRASDASRLEALARTLPRPMVFTNGVFDLLHAGHVDALEHARGLGASLVVGVNSDASARRLNKGPGRPVVAQDDRLRVVQALAVVSAALIFDEDTPRELLCRLEPDIYVKGGAYKIADLPESRVMALWGGRTVTIPRVRPISTSLLVERAARAGLERWP